MFVTRLALDHFRSWNSCVVDLAPKLNIVHGPNGFGKTNLVEAIEVIATGSSARTSSSLPLVEKGHHKATIRANVHYGQSNLSDVNAGDESLEVTVHVHGANRARINGGPSRFMRDVIGRLNCVVFTPDDRSLISGEPAGRRAFLDSAGIQLLPGYYDLIQRCNHVARQRAALLKQIAGSGEEPDNRDRTIGALEAWTAEFIDLGVRVTQARARLAEKLESAFSSLYHRLSAGDRSAGMVYHPSFSSVLKEGDPKMMISRHFRRIYPGELARGQNLIGPQRDDLTLTLHDMSARDYASNGEQWTLALALKMALFQAISAARGDTPIMVLDDVFAQLDVYRRRQIMDFARSQRQVVITTAAAADIPSPRDAHMIDVRDVVDADALE